MPVISNLAFSPSASTIVATWTTDVSADTHFSAGAKAAIDDGVAASGTSHQAIVTGLAPGTPYSCVVTSGGVSSSPQSVTTRAADIRTPIEEIAFGTPTTTGVHGDDVSSFVSSDGKTYVTEDDGYGFGVSPNAGANMQVGVLTDEATLAGADVNLLTAYGGYATSNGTDGPGGTALSNKLTGIFGFGGALYLFQNRSGIVGNLYNEFFGNIMKSNDHGATWNSWQAPGVFNASGIPPSPLGSFQFDNGNIGSAMPIRYAADDGTIGYLTPGNRIDGADGFVYLAYLSAILQNNSHLYLMRVPRIQMAAQSTTAFEYWTGPASPTPADFVNDSYWAGTPASATAIYSATNQVSNGEITFIPALNRYLYLNWYYEGGTTPDTTKSVWQVFEGPTPAGPWTLVGTQRNHPSGWYMPKVLHRTACTNTSLSAIALTIVYSGDYNSGSATYYYPTYSTLTLNPSGGGSMLQLATYNFSAIENPLSDGGAFSTITGYGNLKAIAGNLCEPALAATNSNQVYTGAVPSDDTGGLWPADQYAETTIVSFTGSGIVSAGPGVRMGTGGTGYIFSAVGAGGDSVLYKLTGSGSYSSIGTCSPTILPGDVLRVKAVGTTLTVYQNGTLILTVTDSTYASGNPGLYLYSTNLGDSQTGLFAAGANQAAAPTFSPPAGSYSGSQTVALSSTTPGGLIYYTTDGSTPTRSSASVANGATIVVGSSETVKARASASDFADSVMSSAALTISAPSSGRSVVCVMQ